MSSQRLAMPSLRAFVDAVARLLGRVSGAEALAISLTSYVRSLLLSHSPAGCALLLIGLYPFRFFLAKVLYCLLADPLPRLPGHWLVKFTGIHRILQNILTGKQHERLLREHQKYGPIWRVGPTVVAVADPAAVKTIAVIEDFPKPQVYERLRFLPTVDSIFTCVSLSLFLHLTFSFMGHMFFDWMETCNAEFGKTLAHPLCPFLNRATSKSWHKDRVCSRLNTIEEANPTVGPPLFLTLYKFPMSS
jgi:hypothetical protein